MIVPWFICVDKFLLRKSWWCVEMSLCVEVCKAWKKFKGEVVWLGKFDRIENLLVEVKISLMKGGLTWVELTGLGS